MKPEPVSVCKTCRRPFKRTLKQNAWIWGVAYPAIAKELGNGIEDYDELHYALLSECFGRRRNTYFQIDVPNVTSRNLTVQEFGQYMEWLVRFGAERGAIVPLPNEEAA